MQPAPSIDAFLADPVGRYSLGATHLVWCHSPTLAGTVHFGHPSEADALELTRRLEVSTSPALAGGFEGYMDARGMESFDWPAFGVVAEYVKSRLADWSRRIRKHAVVVPPGVVGVFVAGLMPLIGTSHPLRFFSSVAEAQEWLGRPDLPEVLEQIAQVVEGARGVPPLVRSLREHLEGRLNGATLEGAAQALGTSPRSLQRELHRFGTGFAGELMQARLRAACVLLEHSDEKIEAIARQVGSPSSSQLSALFRRHLGETPAVYRARRRGGGAERTS